MAKNKKRIRASKRERLRRKHLSGTELGTLRKVHNKKPCNPLNRKKIRPSEIDAYMCGYEVSE